MDWKTYLDEIGVDEIDVLWAVWQAEPWGDDREDKRWKIIAQAIAASVHVELPDEVLNYLGRPEPDDVLTEEETAAVLLQAYGGSAK